MTEFTQGIHGAARKIYENNKGSLLIAGREGMFSAGFDLKVMMSNPENASQMVKSGFEMLLRIFSFPRPVIAACSGHGIALGTFLICLL